MEANHTAVSGSSSSFTEIFCRSLALVGVAELFDKTWFMGLILALRYNARTVFIGSFLALLLHCFLAAALGLAFARFLSKLVLSYLTAALFFCFAALYAKDWYQADPESDAIEAGKEDAKGDCELLPQEDSEDGTSTNDTGEKELSTSRDARVQEAPNDMDLTVLGKSFMGVFIAEWGDRTQIAMIGQHASQPLVPVFLGSVVAFFLLTLSAVGAATLLNGQKLRERVVFGFSACCFALFGLLALKDALEASTSSEAEG